jgi:hypothetical protein
MEAGWGLAEREHLPITWLATAVVSLAVGAAILFASTRSAKSGSDSESVSKSVGSDRS